MQTLWTSPQRRDRATGLSILGVAFLAALAISWGAKRASEPKPARDPLPPSTQGLIGFPQQFEPLSALERARSLSDRNQLIGIGISGVSADGTLDLSREDASAVRFTFNSPRGEGPQPPRPAGTLPRYDYCGRQGVIIDHKGIYSQVDEPKIACSKSHPPLPDPRCSLKAVWDFAIARGAPADKRADIEYFNSKAGPAWRFSIPKATQTWVLYGDCKSELSGMDATGSLP